MQGSGAKPAATRTCRPSTSCHCLCSFFLLAESGSLLQEVFRAVLYAELDFDSLPWDSISPQCKDLVQSLLQRDPASRPTAAQALKHRSDLLF